MRWCILQFLLNLLPWRWCRSFLGAFVLTGPCGDLFWKTTSAAGTTSPADADSEIEYFFISPPFNPSSSTLFLVSLGDPSLTNCLHTKTHLKAYSWVTNLGHAFSVHFQVITWFNVFCFATSVRWLTPKLFKFVAFVLNHSAFTVGNSEQVLWWKHLGEGSFEQGQKDQLMSTTTEVGLTSFLLILATPPPNSNSASICWTPGRWGSSRSPRLLFQSDSQQSPTLSTKPNSLKFRMLYFRKYFSQETQKQNKFKISIIYIWIHFPVILFSIEYFEIFSCLFKLFNSFVQHWLYTCYLSLLISYV